MKKLLFFIVMLGISSSAMSANKVFNKYSDMKDVEYMSLNLAVMRSSDGDMKESLEQMGIDDAEGLMVSDFFNRTDEMVMIIAKNKAVSKLMKDINSLRSSYTEVMSIKNEGISYLCLYGDAGVKHEAICAVYEKDSKGALISAIAFVTFGDLTMADVGKLYKKLLSNETTTTTKDGALGGRFSVSTSKTVQFAQGNIQYQPSTATWRLAEHQYDYIGLDNRLIDPSYDGWIDLFGFGTGNNPTLSSIDDEDYSDYVEWGNNTFANGGKDTACWRTLSFNEWWYLFWKRQGADELYGLGEVNGIYGVILLPDDWRSKKNRPAFICFKQEKMIRSNKDNIQPDKFNQMSLEKWAKMEALGAVFLPGGGYRRGTAVHGGEAGNYFSSSIHEDNTAYEFGFNANGISLHPCHRYSGCNVRLVRDCK